MVEVFFKKKEAKSSAVKSEEGEGERVWQGVDFGVVVLGFSRGDISGERGE